MSKQDLFLENRQPISGLLHNYSVINSASVQPVFIILIIGLTVSMDTPLIWFCLIKQMSVKNVLSSLGREN